MKIVRIRPTFIEWRARARELLSENIHYNDVEWIDGGEEFILGETWESVPVTLSINVPKKFMSLAEIVSAFRETSTWSLLYRSLYRLVIAKEDIFSDPLDPDYLDLERRAKLVNRDMHKMKAFVRFKEVTENNQTIYLAWHNPDHRIVRLVSPFFKDRFNGMNWVIMTKDETASWDGQELSFSEGVSEHEFTHTDLKEDLWKTYYKAIFNPGRVKISAMKKELPVRHWKTLPETELISELIQTAPEKLETFYADQRKSSIHTDHRYKSLDDLNSALLKCRDCGICERATAAVPGLGPSNAQVMIVGEQPGDEEDKLGRPFIGPSGELLNQMLRKNEIDRSGLYLTNAVKAFKYIPKAHTRWHKGASLSEIKTCSGWLKNEIEIIKPKTIICLGRSAALAVTGKLLKIQDVRGKVMSSPSSEKLVILPHPASVLRNKTDPEKAFLEYEQDWSDLRKILSSPHLSNEKT